MKPGDERADMWLNFFSSCQLGTVIRASDSTVWQKRGKFLWQTVGSGNEYGPDSIAWPADVLDAGVT